MTRIIAGIWRGRRLRTPAGEKTRPTSEKVREALASSLSASGGLDGARVLDLYAGSGALGLELVSRGAAAAVFVERDRAALAALRANIESLGATAGTGAESPTLEVVATDVAAFVAGAARGDGDAPRPGRFDVVVADPPYELATPALRQVLAAIQRAGLLGPHADVIVERGVRSREPDWPEPLEGVRARRYGDTLLCYGRAP